MKTELNGRTYEIQMSDSNVANPHLKAHLIAQGYDGAMYMGTSHPVGKQRKTKIAMFLKGLKSNEWVAAW